MRINTNLTAMNTYTQYTKNNNKIAGAVAKLSSGYAINNASDNAAGLAISEKMRAQIRGLDQASTNAQDAISLTQTAEGSLSESTEILQRMRELSVQSSNDTNQNGVDREALQDEFSQLQSELNDISKNTSFNKKNLLDGSLAKSTATLSNVSMAKSGLSLELGKASAGSYAFSVGVKQESAAIAGSQSIFHAVSNTDSFTLSSSVTNNLSASSLANGNYTIKAEYDAGNHNMTFTAKGDNGQTFTATLTQEELKTGVNSTNPAPMTLNFKNTDSTDPAFSFTLTTESIYETSNDTTMTNLATQLTDALSLSATNGVDAQAATYGVYAKMTGAEDVKLAAGMDSVTFSNGVKVNFNKLTTTDLDTTNTAALSGTLTAAQSSHTFGTAGKSTISYSNFKAADDNADIAAVDAAAGAVKITSAANVSTGGVTLSFTNNGKTYTAELSSTQVSSLAFQDKALTTDPAKTLSGVQFTTADGRNSFTIDITNKVDVSGTNVDGTPQALDNTDFATDDTASATAALSASAHTAIENVYGTSNSTFSVDNKEGAGLTFQVGANQGDELVINIDKMDANYLGVASLNIGTQDGASAAISAVDKAINTVSSQRAYLGAIQNRLDHKIANLDTSNQNLTSAESEIRDVDMASEMTNFTNANILSQAATAMLAQANSLPKNVLSLLS